MQVRQRERGATAVTVALLLVVIAGFTALVVNVGHSMSVRAQLQNAVDAAALAATRSINGYQSGIGAAHASAETYAELHKTDTVGVQIDSNLSNAVDGDVVHGVWDGASFTPASSSTPTHRVNAVQVRAGRTEARGNPLDMFILPLAGRDEKGVAAEAIAVAGGPSFECSVPLVFADCLVRDADGNPLCEQTLRFTDANIDNVGFTNLEHGSNSTGTSVIEGILLSSNGCGNASVGDWVGVSNGNNLNNRLEAAFQPYINQKVAVAVVDMDCPNPQFNGLREVLGFMTITIRTVTVHPRTIEIDIHCDETSGGDAPAAVTGDSYFGTWARVTQLVQ